ncbi:MAG TPA: serine hydrolase domain-containing protein [Puia sp.]
MRIYIIFLLLLFSVAVKAQSVKPLLTDNKLQTKIDSAVQKAAVIYMQDSNANGISIGIYRNGKKYIYNYGEVKKGTGILPSADNFYNLGSVAKTFVATMLAEAVIEHKVQLDDDIRRYLPSKYPNLEYEGQPIRLVNLANHTSGISKSLHNFPKAVSDSLKKLPLVEQINFYSRFNQDSLLEDLHHIKLDTIPGTKYHYNGSTMMLLILLLERIYHEPYEQIVTSYLQTHLNMYDTKTIISAEEIKRFAQGYDNKNQPQPYFNFKGFADAPSMNSTINDMLKYIEANLSEKDKAIKLTHQLTWGKKDGFGLGLAWMIDTDNGVKYIYHSGSTRIGFNTLCLFYPGKDYGVIIIVNDNISEQKVGDIENKITAELEKK